MMIMNKLTLAISFNWVNPPEQLSKKKQKILEKDLTPNKCMVLPWPTYAEPRDKLDRLGTDP